MRKFAMVLAIPMLVLLAGNSYAGNCTAGGVTLTQSGGGCATQTILVPQPPVIQTFAVAQAPSAPVVAVAQVPLVPQTFIQVAAVQTHQSASVAEIRQFSRARASDGGGNRQFGLFNVSRGGGGNRQIGLINISR